MSQQNKPSEPSASTSAMPTKNSSKTPLPPPPTFDPSVLKNIGTKSSSATTGGMTRANTTRRVSLEAGKVLETLPAPPPLPVKGKEVTKSSTSASTSTIPMTNNSASIGTRTAETTDSPTKEKPFDEELVHEVTESIPQLDSAPNSGNPFASNKSKRSNKSHLSKRAQRDLIQSISKLEQNPAIQNVTTLSTDEEPGPIIPSTKPKQPTRRRITANASSPPHALLSPTQSHLPILLMSTNNAKKLAGKNNLTLPELFTAMGNSLSTHAPSILGRLAPFRSVSRSIMLNWELFQLAFYDAEEFHVESRTVDDLTHEEKALDCACELWEDDLIKVGGKGKGLDLEELEERILIAMHDSERKGGKGENLDNGGNASNSSSEMNHTFQSPTTSAMMNRQDSEDAHDDVPENQVHLDDKDSADTAFNLVSPHKTPWLLRFRSALDMMTGNLPHDTLNCPSLCLLVASTSEFADGLNPIDCLEELANSHHLPKAYQNGLMDPNGFRKQFVLLHDEVDGPRDFKEGTILQEMHNRFGPGCCAVLRINSIPKDDLDQEEEDAVWDNFIPCNNKPESQAQFIADSNKARGTCLSSRDKLAIRRFVAQIITLGLIPSIERRIYNLNVSVTNGKKGVRNVIKSLWRKPKEQGDGSSSVHGGKSVASSSGDSRDYLSNSEVKYRFDSIESQTRLLADTLFLMRDYEASLSMYRLVKDDYKQDNNLFHNASAHEMMALCLHLIDPYSPRNVRETIQNIQSALSYYRAADEERNDISNRPSFASSATRCVTRLCLVLSSTRILCKDMDMEIADLLASASSHETPLGAAVLLEQSSGHYYRAGMYRKFGFHMLMAGHMFRSASQELHAIRCFTSAINIYDNGKKRWKTLSSHLTSALAGQLYSMERMTLSVQLYAKLMGTEGGGRVSVRSQQKYINNLLEIARKYKKDALGGAKQMQLVGIDGIEARSKVIKEYEETMRCNSSAENVLELPNMKLPDVSDSSLRVQAANTEHHTISDSRQGLSNIFGNSSKGLESTWKEMTCATDAELRVASAADSKVLNNDDWVNRVTKEIGEEKTKLKFLERSRKSSSIVGSPAVRARMEPLSVSFSMSNPLSISVPLTEIQLVAKLKCSSTERIFTNEQSVHINTTDEAAGRKKRWSFNGSKRTFEIPEFSRVSSEVQHQPWLSGWNSNIEPFFVVTKVDCSLHPEEMTNINLDICPLVMGDLEILGMRCRIFNEIWVYHQFKVKGPLLQNTAFNRANRVRGKPLLLKSKIECDMPNLSVDIIPVVAQNNSSDSNDIVLQGQISKSTLRITNRGTAPASELVMKTNVPWISFVENNDQSNQETEKRNSDATSFCVGPSGTLMRVPVSGHKNHSKANGDNALYPGETVEIPIEVRTSGGGRQYFYMLIRYELLNKKNSLVIDSTKPKFRWLRKMTSVAVYPSLTVTASLTSSHMKKSDHILSIEMTNYRSDTQEKLDIILDKVCIASKHYKINSLIGPMSETTLSKVNRVEKEKLSGVQIGWQEQVTLHYLISSIDKQDISLVSQCSTNGTALTEKDSITEDQSDMTDFICLEHAHDHFLETLKIRREEAARLEAEKESEGQGPRSIAQIRRSVRSGNMKSEGTSSSSTNSNFHPTSVANLCSSKDNSSEINIICSWKAIAAADVITGQHHLRQLAVRPQHKSKGCPLTISAQHDSFMKHDFSDGPLQTDIQITISNRLVETEVEFLFSLSKQSDLEFLGADSFMCTLDGSGEMVFPLKALIYSSGIHNLQCVKVTVLTGGTETPYAFPWQWIIKVDSNTQ